MREKKLESGICNKGFTLLELLVVIFLLGLMATIVVPNLYRFVPGYERKQFVTELNILLGVAWQDGLKTGKAHKILFDFKKRLVSVQVEQDKRDANGTPIFADMQVTYHKTRYQIPERIELKDLFINSVLEKGKIRRFWFYLAPDGMAQEVIINVVDVREDEEVPIGLVLNPFTAQFKAYETFQKP